MDKINFNKFLWLYWKMKYIYIYIYIYFFFFFFFGGFPIVEMKKKNVVKKKNGFGNWMGYCPTESR